MDKYLSDLLHEIKTIIIPGIGALTLIDRDKNEIMFMSYLRHDDGTLATYIAERENLDLNDAKIMVSKYAREILAQLDTGERYDMFQFGSFMKGSDGEIEFTTWQGDIKDAVEDEINVAPESIQEFTDTEAPLDVTSKESTSDKTPKKSPVTDPIKESIEEPKAKLIQDVIEDVEIPSEISDQNFETPAVEETEKWGSTKTRELNILEKEERAATQAKLEALRKQKVSPKQVKRKKGIGFYALVLLIVIVVAGSAYVVFDFGNIINPPSSEELAEGQNKTQNSQSTTQNDEGEVTENEDSKTTQEEVQINVPEPEVQEQTVVDVPEEPQPVTTPTPVTKGNGQYHIIAGSFASQSNAQRFAEKLNSSGTSATIIESRGLYRISLGSFSSRPEAKDALQRLNYSGSALVSYVD